MSADETFINGYKAAYRYMYGISFINSRGLPDDNHMIHQRIVLYEGLNADILLVGLNSTHEYGDQSYPKFTQVGAGALSFKCRRCYNGNDYSKMSVEFVDDLGRMRKPSSSSLVMPADERPHEVMGIQDAVRRVQEQYGEGILAQVDGAKRGFDTIAFYQPNDAAYEVFDRAGIDLGETIRRQWGF